MDKFLSRPASKRPAAAHDNKRARASPATTGTTAGGSKFTDCPICNRSVPLSLINEHIDSGCSAAEPTPPPLALPPATSRCPICGLTVPLSLINEHIDSGCGSVEAVPPPQQPPVTQPPSTSSQPSPMPSQRPPPQPAGSNAFEALKRGAEALKPRHVQCTFLPGPPPRLRWSTVGCGSTGAVEGEWSCEVDVRSTPPVKLILRQEMPHRFDRFDRRTLPEWFTHSHGALRVHLTDLSVPALKSALQKNIRLGRPVASIRCAWALLRHADPTGNGPSGAVELLRRLPIIAFEDGLPPPLLGPLTWLMVAHTAKTPLPLSSFHVNVILAATLQMASCRYREPMVGRGARDGRGVGALPSLADLVSSPTAAAAASAASASAAGCPGVHDVQVPGSRLQAPGVHDVEPGPWTLGVDVEPAPFRAVGQEDQGPGSRGQEDQEEEEATGQLASDVAACCVLRAAYGGMAGDVAMLQRAAATWAARGARGAHESFAWGARLRSCAGEAMSAQTASSAGEGFGHSSTSSTLVARIVDEALRGPVRPPDASMSCEQRGSAGDASVSCEQGGSAGDASVSCEQGGSAGGGTRAPDETVSLEAESRVQGPGSRVQGGTRAFDETVSLEAELRLAMRGEGGLRWADVPLSSLDFH